MKVFISHLGQDMHMHSDTRMHGKIVTNLARYTSVRHTQQPSEFCTDQKRVFSCEPLLPLATALIDHSVL